MSRIPGRIRLVFTEEEATALPQTHIVLRQRVFWVMLLGAFLALLCLPVHRGVVWDQVYGVVTHQPVEWAQVGALRTGIGSAQLRKVLGDPPADRDLQLGAVLLGDWRNAGDASQQAERETVDLQSPRLQYLQRLSEQYPHDPVVLAAYLRYATLKGVNIQRPEDDRKSSFKPTAPAVFARFEADCLRGARLDPDNGYFPTLLAVVRFAGGRDEAALEALHQASLATRWSDYAEAERVGAQALLIRAYGDRGPLLRVGPTSGVLLPHVTQVRRMARVAILLADQRLDRGELQRGHAIHADVVRLGRLMRLNSRYLIGRLVGGAVELIGLRILPPSGSPAAPRGKLDEVRQAQRRAYERRVAREAPSYLAEIQRANREQDASVANRRRLSVSTGFAEWGNLLDRMVWREVLGLSLVANLGVSMLVWGAAALLGVLMGSSHGQRGPFLISWLGKRVHPLIRIVVGVGVGLGTVGALTWALAGDARGYLLLPALVLPFWLPTSSAQEMRPVSVRSLVSLALGSLAVMAVLTWPWKMSELQQGWWKDVAVSSTLNGDGSATEAIQNLAFAHWLPSGVLLALALPVVVIGVATVRRWALPATVERLRLVAKGLAGILAIGYLGYLLAFVPSSQQDSRSWERLIQRETQGFPL
jgi:hypothetical protein